MSAARLRNYSSNPFANMPSHLLLKDGLDHHGVKPVETSVRELARRSQ